MLRKAKRRRRAGYIIPDMFALFLTIVIAANGALADASADEDGKSGVKYAEVEVLLSDNFGVEDSRALPKAPGSDLEFLDNAKRVRAQLPGEEVKALVGRGADITVLRKFVLREGFQTDGVMLDGGAMALASCSGPNEYGENHDNVPIPDAPDSYNCGGWVWSEIGIWNAPGGATVTCVDVHYEIIHSWVGDLIVDLSDEGLSVEYNLFDDMYANWANLDETETGITTFNGEMVNQVWLLWAMDCGYLDSGHIDYWWIKVYYEDIPPPPNDDCSDAIAVSEGVPYSGSTVGATEDGQSSCSYNDTADVWHSYTPNSPGLVTISLAGSAFDTTLAVFDGCEGTELACNDDTCEGLQSEIMMTVTDANTYLIRVAGYWGSAGDYTLTVTNSGCDLPPGPNSPSPANDVNNVSLQAILSWNGGEAYASGGIEATISSEGVITPKVIYGDDDRLDEYEVNDANILAAGDSTVALLSLSDLIDNGDGTFSLPSETYAEWYELADPIGTGNPLCSDEPFRDQPNPAWCSGFLVAPDIIATTGHCACPDDCLEMAIVFGFVMLDANTPVLTIDESQIYYCSEVIARQIGDPDWALIRLDREVTGHSPLGVRSEGAVADGSGLIVIGYPIGLPKKIRMQGQQFVRIRHLGTSRPIWTLTAAIRVRRFSIPRPLKWKVFYMQEVAMDFVEDGSCDRSNVCPNTGCPGWEYVTRTTEFSAFARLAQV